MTIPTFTPPIAPTYGTSNKPKVSINKAEFGDGYVQACPTGLNNIRRIYSLSWDVLEPADAASIMTFLQATFGCNPFYYTPSDESTHVLFTCNVWTDERIQGGLRKVTATFEESFILV